MVTDGSLGRIRLIAFDFDDTLCPTGRILPVEQVALIDETPPGRFVPGPHLAYTPFPAALELVKRLHAAGAGPGLVSNSRSNRQRNKIRLSGLERYLAAGRTLISEECAWELCMREHGRGPESIAEWQEYVARVEKPRPYMLQELTHRTGIPAAESLYVGNDDADRLAAWSAGWRFHHVKAEDDLRRLDEKLGALLRWP
jgi:FMN phosphatase YigB (HAD superfamily)